MGSLQQNNNTLTTSHSAVGLRLVGTQRGIRLLRLAGELGSQLVAPSGWNDLVRLHHSLEGEQICLDIVLIGQAIESYSLVSRGAGLGCSCAAD